MAISENTSGTQAATVTTEHTLATITSAGVFQLVVDIGNMVAGDSLELRVDIKTLTGSTAATAFFATYAHLPGVDAQVVMSPPIPSPFSIAFTLLQATGTSRNFDWGIWEYGNA